MVVTVLPRFLTISSTLAGGVHMLPASSATMLEFLSMAAFRSAGNPSYLALFMARKKLAV
jgi:hypothetical protein